MNMRRFLKHAAHRRTRLFVPVVEYGLTEFAVTVRQIAPPSVINLRSILRLNRRSMEKSWTRRNYDRFRPRGATDPTLQQKRAALVDKY